MENKTHSVSVLEQCVVTPASASNDIHARLSFLDMPWLFISSVQKKLSFYKIPDLSRSQFLQNIFPKLRTSLSLTLDHFPLVAGNLIIPPNTNSSMPEICFRNGDGVSLICAEANNIDFNHLVRNDERDCDEFYSLVPELKSQSSEVSTTSTVVAVQVTLFPGFGLSVGISHQHALGDGKSIFMFMNTLSLYSFKLSQPKDELLVSESELLHLPAVFDRNVIQDNKGLAKIICDQWMNRVSSRKVDSKLEPPLKNNKVRKTFLISADHVKKLKSSVSEAAEVHVSSFVVALSYVWTCLVKSRHQEGDEQTEHILFPADCRERSDPPVPANYFGNCVSACYTNVSGTELAGEFGFRRACEVLGRTIKEKFRRKDSVFDIEENLTKTLSKVNWAHCLTLAGSPRHNFYDLDFGWGTAVKFEFISIDSNGAISLSGCRDSDGGVEVGLALTLPQMKAFSSIFVGGLNS